MKISYKWLKEYVPELPEAKKLRDIFSYHICEVEGFEKKGSDTVFDLNILPNRAHDLLSHQGVAQELASLLALEFVRPRWPVISYRPTNLKIEIKSNKCRRYIGRILRQVKVGPSPQWLAEKLEAIGQRSINNIVDAANFVMFDQGNPIHIFDLDKITGHLVVREALVGEEITTLDNQKVVLNENNLVIADENNILAIAGIKGGRKAEVDKNTKNIIIEVANFDPIAVRKTAHQVKIHTDAVKRFENNLSPELCEEAMNEVTAIILKLCPEALVEAVVDFYPKKQKERKINFSADFVNKKLGANISASKIEKILQSYHYEYQREGDNFEIVVPPVRLDLETPDDLVEEIGRVIGYDKIKSKILKINFQPKVNETFYKILWARKKILKEGYNEVMTYSFGQEGKVEVLESASDKRFLRPNLINRLKESFQLNKNNAPLLGLKEIKIFEIGTVWNPQEEIHVAFGDKSGFTEMPLDEFCQDLEIKDYKEALGGRRKQPAKFKQWSSFPFIVRDIAVWLPKDKKPEKLVEIFKEEASELLARPPELFDRYEKEGKISYAHRLVFQSRDRTFTDEEVNKIMAKITTRIVNLGWQVR